MGAKFRNLGWSVVLVLVAYGAIHFASTLYIGWRGLAAPTLAARPRAKKPAKLNARQQQVVSALIRCADVPHRSPRDRSDPVAPGRPVELPEVAPAQALRGRVVSVGDTWWRDPSEVRRVEDTVHLYRLRRAEDVGL
jgi:hypothetical protein